MTAATVLYARSRRRRLPETAGIAAAVLAGQLSIGWQNDALDAVRDRAAGRRDKPAARGEVTPASLAAAAVVAGAASVPLSLRLGRPAGWAHLAAVTAGTAYNLGLRATALSPMPYLVAFGLLPAVVDLASPDGRRPPAAVLATASLLGGAAHVANVLPDLDDDVAHGIVGLPHRLGRRGAIVLLAGLLLAVGALLEQVPGAPARWRHCAAGWSLAVAAGTLALEAPTGPGPRRPSRAAFHLVTLGAVVDAGLLLAATRAAPAPSGRPPVPATRGAGH